MATRRHLRTPGVKDQAVTDPKITTGGRGTWLEHWSTGVSGSDPWCVGPVS